MDRLSLQKAFTGAQTHSIIRKSVMVLVLLFSDTISFILSFLLAHHLRIHVIPHNFTDVPVYSFPLAHYYPFWWLVIPLYILFLMEGLYFRRRLFLMELKHILKSLILYTAAVLALISLMQLSTVISRIVIVLSAFITLLLLPLIRYFTKIIAFDLGLWRKNVLILGAAKTGTLICQSLKKNKFLGYQVTGFLDDDEKKTGTSVLGIKVLGRIENIREILKDTTTLDVIIAMPSLTRERLLEIVEICEHYVESIRIIPDLFGIATIGAEIDSISDFLMINININLKKPWNIFMKRVLDVVLSLIVLIAGAPVLILIAAAIRLDSPGPALFLQKRLGQSSGKGRFPCFKFRTMYLNSNERLQEYLASHPEAQQEWEQFAKLKSEDPRVTRVGRWLRKTSLDELPQVLNVIRGEMSLVGPRPYLPREIEKMDNMEKTILVAKPGITGLWQVSGRNELSFKTRCTMDIYYVRNWSLWMDLVILAKTAYIVFSRKGAY